MGSSWIIRPSTGQMLLFAWMAKRPRHGAVSTSTFRRMWQFASSCVDAGRHSCFEENFGFCAVPRCESEFSLSRRIKDIGCWCWPSCCPSPNAALMDPGVCAKQLEVSKVRMLHICMYEYQDTDLLGLYTHIHQIHL